MVDENEFVDIKGYEGLYQINRKGEVKSLERYVKHYKGDKRLLKERILVNSIGSGYYKVRLWKDEKPKTLPIHKLLINTFVSEYDTKYYTVDHINKNSTDNNLDNLRIIQKRDNCSNRKDDSKYGTCVYLTNSNTFNTKIQIKGKITRLGNYLTQEQAHQKYLEVKNQIDEIEKVTRNYTFKRYKIGKEYFIELFHIL